MSEVLEKMQTRRSIRRFKSDMLPKDAIEKIAEAGTFAASGMNLQTPVIIAVTNKEIRDKMSKANAQVMGSENDPFYGAPCVLVRRWCLWCLRKRREPMYTTEVLSWEI